MATPDLLTRAVLYGAAALPSRTVSLPVGASRPLAWPAQDPAAIHTCVLDCALFLLDAGTTLASALVSCDPSLTAGGVGHDAAKVWVTLTGGALGTFPVVSFALFLANGDRMNATVALPVVALSPAIPAGAVAVGGQPLTLAHIPIDVSEMPALPGGVLIGDKLLVYRPGPAPNVFLLAAASLGGEATGGVTAASLALVLATLPTAPPDSTGQLWLNAGALTLS